MILKNINSLILQKLSQKGFSSESQLQLFSVSGGSINETYRLVYGKDEFFCKINSASHFPGLFEKERSGLEFIARHGVIKTPEVIDHFETGNHQVLLMKWVHSGERNKVFWKKFGEQLAALHLVKGGYFGLNENNYMGTIPQSNHKHNNWSRFFVDERIQPLLVQCSSRQLLDSKHIASFEKLFGLLPQIFSDDQKPVLLHGDLWNGNFICNDNSEPVLIDPAIYFGHPSVDLGMTTLFGGFNEEFYTAYNYHNPFPDNHKQQWQICNLYPLLIHLLLFGRGYLAQIEFTMQQFD